MQDNYDLIVLLLDTGARYGEIANIRWSQINIEQKSISLWRSKVKNESIIFMTDRAFEIIQRRALSACTAFLFSNKAGQARGYSSIAIRKAFRRAGLQDCKIHTVRHTHASRLIQNGLSVYEVRSVLGHTDIKTTVKGSASASKAAVPLNIINIIQCFILISGSGGHDSWLDRGGYPSFKRAGSESAPQGSLSIEGG